MRLEPSTVAGVVLAKPRPEVFTPAIESLLGTPAREALWAAVPFSVVIHNNTERAIAFLGVRFDMTGRSGKPYSVVHYAETLRYPEKAAIQPGAARFVCAEPLYTDLVLGRTTPSRDAETRARMNVANLAKARQVKASLDCVGFVDGQFAGPDSLSVFSRLGSERRAEKELIAEVLESDEIEEILSREIAGVTDSARARKALARRMKIAFDADGPEGVRALARAHRFRIELTR